MQFTSVGKNKLFLYSLQYQYLFHKAHLFHKLRGEEDNQRNSYLYLQQPEKQIKSAHRLCSYWHLLNSIVLCGPSLVQQTESQQMLICKIGRKLFVLMLKQASQSCMYMEIYLSAHLNIFSCLSESGETSGEGICINFCRNAKISFAVIQYQPMLLQEKQNNKYLLT